MQNTTQKTNQRMPGRSETVVGNELKPGGATPSAKPITTKEPIVVKKPVIKLDLKAKHHH